MLTTLLLCALSNERRRAAERMRRSEARFRSLTNLSVDWYWEQDEQFRFTEISPAFQAVHGFEPSESLGKRRWEMPYESLATRPAGPSIAGRSRRTSRSATS